MQSIDLSNVYYETRIFVILFRFRLFVSFFPASWFWIKSTNTLWLEIDVKLYQTNVWQWLRSYLHILPFCIVGNDSMVLFPDTCMFLLFGQKWYLWLLLENFINCNCILVSLSQNFCYCSISKMILSSRVWLRNLGMCQMFRFRSRKWNIKKYFKFDCYLFLYASRL